MVVPFSSKGGWLNATSRPSPTETEGTALGMKKTISSTKRGGLAIRRRARAAQVPLDQGQ